jgi:hypothetical protein
MNVFILNTGRCGSTTFIKACAHITNFTSAHESRTGRLGEDRFAYPSGHIEADNRLSWLLGRLDRHFGKQACYVHLRRKRAAAASSFMKRYSAGIINAYRKAILMDLPGDSNPFTVASDYCDTVDSNIELFLRDKPKKMDFDLETSKEDFRRFWEFIGAEGKLEAALREFDVSYNPSEASDIVSRGEALVRRTFRNSALLKKVDRAIRMLAGPQVPIAGQGVSQVLVEARNPLDVSERVTEQGQGTRPQSAGAIVSEKPGG